MPDDSTKKLAVAIEATSNLAAVAGEDKKAVEGVTQATAAATKEETAQTATTGDLNLKKRELLESMRGITREFPLMGEVARAAFNPMVTSIFGVIEAVNIWLERMKTAEELLGGFELPDLTEHSVGVSAAAEAYDKLKTAVADANTEFNSATGIYERQAKAVEAQLAATKLMIEAEKKKAEADLDVQKATGQITPVEYIERKAALEKWSVEQTDKAETDARNNQLALKKKEIDDLGKQAASEAAKGGAIQPGLNDAALDDQIKKAHAAADDLAQKAAAFRAEAQHAEDVAERAQGGQGLPGLADVAHNALGDVAFFAKYGLTADPEKVKQLNNDAARAAEEREATASEQARQLEKQKTERDKHNAEAARLAGLQATKADEFRDDNDPNVVGSTAWQNAQAAARAPINSGTADSETHARVVDQFKNDFKTISTTKNADALKAALDDIVEILRRHTDWMEKLPDYRQDIAVINQRMAILESQSQRSATNTLSF